VSLHIIAEPWATVDLWILNYTIVDITPSVVVFFFGWSVSTSTISKTKIQLVADGLEQLGLVVQ
jgi:hypothetical protein